MSIYLREATRNAIRAVCVNLEHYEFDAAWMHADQVRATVRHSSGDLITLTGEVEIRNWLRDSEYRPAAPEALPSFRPALVPEFIGGGL